MIFFAAGKAPVLAPSWACWDRQARVNARRAFPSPAHPPASGHLQNIPFGKYHFRPVAHVLSTRDISHVTASTSARWRGKNPSGFNPSPAKPCACLSVPAGSRGSEHNSFHGAHTRLRKQLATQTRKGTALPLCWHSDVHMYALTCVLPPCSLEEGGWSGQSHTQI